MPWSGLPAVKLDSDYAKQVIVVASNDNNSSSTGTLSSFSNRGSLVDLAAPGGSVSVLNKSGSIVTQSGTSLSAPFAAGAGGLVATFDVTLDSSTASTTSQLKTLILQGAVDGGRTAGGYPIVNAYQSLRRAARKHGARLCGNLVWAQGNRTISVMRNDSTNDVETLVTGLKGEPFFLMPAHQGKYIYFFLDTLSDTVGTYYAVESFTSGQWQTTPSYGGNPPDNNYLPAYHLSNERGYDHDGANHVLAQLGAHDSTNIYFNFSSTPSTAIVGNPACCMTPQAVLNPAGTEAWVTGYGYPILNNDSVWTAYVYKMPRANNATPVLVDSIPQAQILTIGPAEDGSGFYVDIFYQTNGTGLSTCNEDFVDTTWTTFKVLASVSVQSSLLCASKNVSEASERVAARIERNFHRSESSHPNMASSGLRPGKR